MTRLWPPCIVVRKKCFHVMCLYLVLTCCEGFSEIRKWSFCVDHVDWCSCERCFEAEHRTHSEHLCFVIRLRIRRPTTAFHPPHNCWRANSLHLKSQLKKTRDRTRPDSVWPITENSRNCLRSKVRVARQHSRHILNQQSTCNVVWIYPSWLDSEQTGCDITA